MVRKLLAAAGALVAGFHVWLFVSQLGNGELVDVSLLARWGVAGLIVAALWYLRRQNMPMFWGRRAVAVWLLAAVLHAPSVSDRLLTSDAIIPEEVAAVLAQVSAGATLLLLIVLAAVLLAAATTAGVRRYRFAPATARRSVRRASTEPLAARPPPAR